MTSGIPTVCAITNHIHNWKQLNELKHWAYGLWLGYGSFPLLKQHKESLTACRPTMQSWHRGKWNVEQRRELISRREEREFQYGASKLQMQQNLLKTRNARGLSPSCHERWWETMRDDGGWKREHILIKGNSCSHTNRLYHINYAWSNAFEKQRVAFTSHWPFPISASFHWQL